MKCAAVLIVLLSVPVLSAFAEEGDVPQETLKSLGLSDMQSMTDEEGLEVRGMHIKAAKLTFDKGFLIGRQIRTIAIDSVATVTISAHRFTHSAVRSHVHADHKHAAAFSFAGVSVHGIFSGVFLGAHSH